MNDIKNNKFFRHTLLTLLTLCVISLNGCGLGYTAHDIYPEQYQTVAVPIFENRTFWNSSRYTGLEADLAEALAKEVESRTPYKVASPATADTIIQGTITGFEQRVITRKREGNVPEQMEIIMTVNFEWKDQRTSQTIVDRKGYQAIGRYTPTRPVNELLSIGQHQAISRMANQIVNTMRTNW
ncbi:LptE family protein [Planctomycetota bacterium]|nr:LptE family protein [Planctomycetota bacterium]